MVEIKGLEKFSSKDFPGHISSTVFLGGCTFRCPFCHNSDLVLRPESFPTMPMNLFLAYLDGRKLGEPIDLYNPDPVPGGEVDFGVHQLKAGEHKLMLEMVGINEKAVKACHAGIDYVRLVAVQ